MVTSGGTEANSSARFTPLLGRLQVEQHRTLLHLVAFAHVHGSDQPVARRLEAALHLHGFQHGQRLALGHAVARRDQELGHLARHRGGEQAAVLLLAARGEAPVLQDQGTATAVERQGQRMADDRGRKAAAPAVALDPDASVGHAATGVQFVSPEPRGEALAGALDRDHVQVLAVEQPDQAARRLVEAPGVEPVPGRGPVGAGDPRRRRSGEAERHGRQGGQEQCGGVGRLLGGERLRAFPVEPAGIQPHPLELGAGRGGAQEAEVGRDTLDQGGVEGSDQALQRRRPVGAIGDDLGDHRVVVGRDGIAFLDAGIDPHTVQSRGQPQGAQPPDGGQEAAGRVLGVEPRLEGMAPAGDLRLSQRQRLAGGDAQLPLDQIQPGDRLGHRVLDLEAGVHLDEVEAARLVEQELDRAGVLVPGGERGTGGRAAQCRTQFRRRAPGPVPPR